MEYLPPAVLARNMRRRKAPRKAKDKETILDTSTDPEGKVLPVSEIILQARDIPSRTDYVFVIWAELPLSSAEWVPLRNLTVATASSWRIDREIRFPHFADEDFPELPISGLIQQRREETEARLSSDSDE